jgi:plasmid maintenance system antidote protein VapI
VSRLNGNSVETDKKGKDMPKGHASLSADMALRFEQQFKISADTLMRMQMSYDLAQARMQLAG